MKNLILVFILTVGIAAMGATGKCYPDSVTIHCGKLNVRLGAATFWNINRIQYDNVLVSVDSRGAYWGTVFMFPGVGFVGSGHTENKDYEKVQDIKIFADGKYISPDSSNANEIKCSEFKMIKHSRVKNITFTYNLVIKSDRIIENCKHDALKDTPLNLMYNFMHPWSSQMTNYYIETASGNAQEGNFKTDNKFPYRGKFSWVALYNNNNHAGVVSKLTKGNAVLFLWDRKYYKKTYLCSFIKKTLHSGKAAEYGMVTAFFLSPAGKWHNAAKNIVSKL
jgi:hypothetical protein